MPSAWTWPRSARSHFDAAGVTLTPTGTLKLDGSLDVKAGTLAVSQTIRGGTLISDGGTINYIGGTLDGVTLNGALAVGATNSVTIQDGITFSGAGPEQILVDGTLHLADNETLSNAAITLNGVIDTEHSDTLTLSGSTTLTGNGSLEGTTDNKGTITINGGGLSSGFEPTGSLNTALINEGTITLSGGAQARIDNLLNSGTILLSGAGTTLTLPDDTTFFEFENNLLSLADGATFVLNPSFVGASYNLGSITFSGENNVLQLGGTSLGLHSSTFRGDLIGFVSGDQIDLQGTGFNVSYANGELDISNLSFVNRFELSGADYADAQFTLTVTNGSTILTTTADAPCFCTGTLILTDRGERPVESLSPGDRVVTRQDGAEATLTVRWVGRRRVRVGRHPEPDHVHPVHIRRDAIAPGQP